MVDIGLYITYALTILCALGALALPLIKALQNNPKSLAKIGIAVVALIVLYFIGYAIASDVVTERYAQYGITEGSSKNIGGILYLTYILFFAAVIAMFGGGLLRLVVNR